MLELLDCIKLTAVQWLQLLVSLQDVSSSAAATVHSAQHAETAVSTAVALAAPLLTIVCSERAQHTVSLLQQQQQQQQLGATSATLTSTLPAATAIAAAATTATPTSAQHHDKNLALVVGFLLTALELAWGKTDVYKLVNLLLELTVAPGGVSLEYLLQQGYRIGYAKWQSTAVTDITSSSNSSSSSVKAVQTLSDFSVHRADAGEDQLRTVHDTAQQQQQQQQLQLPVVWSHQHRWRLLFPSALTLLASGALPQALCTYSLECSRRCIYKLSLSARSQLHSNTSLLRTLWLKLTYVLQQSTSGESPGVTSLLHAGASLLVEVAETGLVQGGYWEVQQQQQQLAQFRVLLPLRIKAAAAAASTTTTAAIAVDETPAARPIPPDPYAVDCSGLLQLLLNVLINSPDAQLRKRGYYSVLAIITAAEPAHARCDMLLQLIARCPFTGAKGLLIDALRGEVKRAVSSVCSSSSSTCVQQQPQASGSKSSRSPFLSKQVGELMWSQLDTAAAQCIACSNKQSTSAAATVTVAAAHKLFEELDVHVAALGLWRYALASTDSSVAQSLQLFTARSSSELAQQLQHVRDGAAVAYSMWHTVEAASAISNGIKSSASLTSMISSTQTQQQQQQQRAPADYFRLGLLDDAAVRLLELVPEY
eukprot:3794-Heterococcus_DN1.PRE.4